VSPDFKPFRVDVDYLACHAVKIHPLFERLTFIRDKTRWCGTFRFGYLKVTEADFALIADAMNPSSAAPRLA
jgi:predicted RNA-binding protein